MEADHKRKPAVDNLLVNANTGEPLDLRPTPKKAKNAGSDGQGSSTTETKKSIQDVLSGLTAQEVLPWMKEGGTIDLLSTFTFYEALTILIDNKISSAPVKDVDSGKYIGFVDMVDLATATVDILMANNTFEKMKTLSNTDTATTESTDNNNNNNVKDNKEEEDNSNNNNKNKKINFDEEVNKRIRREREYAADDEDPFSEAWLMNSISVKSLTDLSRRDPFIRVKESDSLLKVAEVLQHHHRIAVIDDKDSLLGVITQSGFIEYLSEEHALWLEGVKKKVKDFQLTSTVYSLNIHNKAIDALKMMKEKRVTGLAVVNDKGKLVDVVSASDLMLWSEWSIGGHPLRFRHIAALTMNLQEFLQNSRAQRYGSDYKTSNFPIVCKKSTLASEALSTMLEYNIHRLFVVDTARKPISVVTFGDLISDLLFPNNNQQTTTTTKYKKKEDTKKRQTNKQS